MEWGERKLRAEKLKLKLTDQRRARTWVPDTDMDMDTEQTLQRCSRPTFK